jgi:hypothetical protein
VRIAPGSKASPYFSGTGTVAHPAEATADRSTTPSASAAREPTTIPTKTLMIRRKPLKN